METRLSSFFAGGFESASHRRADRLQLDLVQSTNHHLHAAEDFRLLQQVGISTVRDALRWHLIETVPGIYDWSSFLPMLQASIDTGTQVIWDLCHWGIPSYLDIFSSEFVDRFAAFAAAAAALIREYTDTIPYLCPINEMSFWSWIGAEIGIFHPHMNRRGVELKRQLVRASLAAIRAVRAVDTRARFVQPEPIINVVADQHDPEKQRAAQVHTQAQYEAWDWLSADNANSGLDIVGVNYYWDNQWLQGGARIALGHAQHRPLHLMLLDVWNRYHRPIFLSETGAEAEAGAGWLGYICAEIRQAQRQGADILGVCLYPVMDYPGWDDDRHCCCGLIEVDEQWKHRSLRSNLAAELRNQQRLFSTA